MKLAVIGATGLVGSEILEVLEEHHFPYDELLLVASERSVGKQLAHRGKQHTIISLAEAVASRPEIAIVSAGGSTRQGQWTGGIGYCWKCLHDLNGYLRRPGSHGGFRRSARVVVSC